MIVINMSEYKEEHKVSRLTGSPPGYVGYGEGGVLTEAVRRRPYSVVLLDEVEKAHPGVQDIFYQVFDKGTLQDGEGREIDFKNTIILLTSNVGTDTIHEAVRRPGDHARRRPDWRRRCGRNCSRCSSRPSWAASTTIPYFPLSDEVMRKIIELQLRRIGRRVRENYRAKFTYAPELVAGIAARCKEVETGARNVDHILTRSMLPEMAAEFLERMAAGKTITAVHVSLNEKGGFQYAIS